jgi:alkylhydroperoxidase family enzyme
LDDDIWDAADPELLELARLRIAMLLGADPADLARPRRAPLLAPEKVDNLRAWPTSPLYSERERACLGLTEQFVMDVAGVTDDDVAAAREWLSPNELYGFVTALYILEFGQRMHIADRRLTPSEGTPA